MGHANNIYVAVIDDDESLCRSLGRLLRAAGFQPVSYSSAEMFLRDQKHPQFDCLILDVQLAGMSGVDLYRELKRVGTVPPVIFITAGDDPDARRQAEALGCAAFLLKTDPGTAVLAAVRRAAGMPPLQELHPKNESQA